jgi:hypothetical protein
VKKLDAAIGELPVVTRQRLVIGNACALHWLHTE